MQAVASLAVHRQTLPGRCMRAPAHLCRKLVLLGLPVLLRERAGTPEHAH